MQATYNEGELVLKLDAEDTAALVRAMWQGVGAIERNDTPENLEAWNVVRNLFDTAFYAGFPDSLNSRVEFPITEPKAVMRRI